MSRRLIVTDGGREREVLVVATVVVGRDPTCDITGTDDLLSRRHAEFSLANNRVLVRDLGSRNGVFVNGTRVAETALNSNDLVQIGQLKIRFLSDDRPLTAAVAAIAPLPALATPVVDVDEDLTGYRPAPPSAPSAASVPPSIGSRTMTLGDDEATSFVPAGSRTTSMPPSISEPPPVSAPPAPPPRISAPTAVLDDPFAVASAPVPAPAPTSAASVDRAPKPAPRSTSMGLFAVGVVMALGAVGVLVWQGQQAGLALWLVAPLVVALVGAALVGSAIAGKAEQ